MYTINITSGSGTRLFPLSRSSYPKQFIPLLRNESLFQKAVKCAHLFSKPDEIYIVTNAEHKFLGQNQFAEIDMPECKVLLEPCGRNTPPAKTKHRLTNETDELLEVVEVQQGYPLTEEDIVRIDDDFRRC